MHTYKLRLRHAVARTLREKHRSLRRNLFRATQTAARSRATRHRYNVLLYIGIDIIASYPLPGLYTRRI